LYDANGYEKFPLVGDVTADAHWWRGPLTGGVAALVLLIIARSVLGIRSALPLTQIGIAGFAFGCLGMLQWDYLWYSNRDWQEWTVMSIWTLLCNVICLARLFDYNQRWPRAWNTLLLLLLLISMSYINLGLVFNARYRDFPSAFVLLPIALLALKGTQPARLISSSEGLLLGAWLLLSAPIIVALEFLSNGSALLWCFLSGLLGWRMLFDHLIASRLAASRLVTTHQ
jgi:glucan 1,3-beta-glucosidase